MSYDLTLWHDPKLRSYDRAMARLERVKPASARDRARLVALRDALLADPHVRAALSVDPEVDEANATLGLCLTGGGLDEALTAVATLQRAHGAAVYDPQDGVVTYANGASSRDEKAPDGIHEGVAICLRELTEQPPLPVATQIDALDALAQFVLADSPDVLAAAQRALPVIDALASGSPDEAVRHKAINIAYEIRDTAPIP